MGSISAHENSIFSRCFLDFTRIPLDNSDARKQRLFGLNILKRGWFWWWMVHLVALAVCRAWKQLALYMYKIPPCDFKQINLHICVSFWLNFCSHIKEIALRGDCICTVYLVFVITRWLIWFSFIGHFFIRKMRQGWVLKSKVRFFDSFSPIKNKKNLPITIQPAQKRK